jgi:hypothetical protein
LWLLCHRQQHPRPPPAFLKKVQSLIVTVRRAADALSTTIAIPPPLFPATESVTVTLLNSNSRSARVAFPLVTVGDTNTAPPESIEDPLVIVIDFNVNRSEVTINA